MKRLFTNWSLLFCVTFISSFAVAQQDWPKTISASNGDLIKIYQPQPESYSNNILKSRAAISIIQSGKTEPVFGTWWFTAQTASTGDGRSISIQSLQVNDLRFPSDVDDSKIDGIKSTLQNEVPKMGVRLAESDVQNALNINQQQSKLASNLNNNPPKVFYSTKPSMLVMIDGTPKLEMNSDWGVEAVVNSPYTIVKNSDGRFYLYGGKHWFSAPDATGPYQYTPSVPGNLQTVQAAVDKAAADNAATANSDASANGDNNNTTDPSASNSNAIPEIIVSTEPAELIQSNGEPNFSPIEGTGLLYVKNSGNDIFMNVNSQQYYVLLAGRWYKSDNLHSTWQFINSSELPADFAKIPQGSPKDNVLASVAGTEAANDAVMDAQVPQTAKVDRNTASTNVTYDGNPQFENIDGTHLQYSQNSSASVLRYHGRYYTVDNGVWFESGSAEGPWTVATERPDEVSLIPPSYPVYNMQYVDIYDVTPDYVYTGYYPGYLNNYIYGSTCVYGTGYYYRPWYGRHYYPRAFTWGFGMGYNPWYGWSVGWDLSFGWFNIGLGGSRWNYWGGGWWGPRAYRPAYFGGRYGGGFGGYGYYGARGRTIFSQNNRTTIINRNYTNNIYQNRSHVITNNNRSFANRGFNTNRTTHGGPGGGTVNNNAGNSNNGFNNRGRQTNNGNGFGNNNRATTPGNNVPHNNNNYSRPARINPTPGNNNNNRVQNNNSTPNPGRVNNRQYSRPQQQRTYNPGNSRPAQAPARIAPQPQQRPSNGGGGVSRPSSGGSRPSSGGGGGGGRSSGGGGGGGSHSGGRRG